MTVSASCPPVVGSAAPPGAMAALRVDGLVKRFGGRVALDGAALTVAAGEILGLLGPNGAGKSTLVRAVTGRVRPDGGTVSVFGRPVTDPAARAVVGYVPQELALYPALTVRENLTVFGRYQGLSGAALAASIDHALDWAALGDRTGARVRELSGGMKRRLNMAAGVLHAPRLVLLDEPTVGVDPQSRERVYAMIGGLRARGVAVVYTTHYMEEAERLCDRVAIIDHGRVVVAGTRDELVARAFGPGREIRATCGADVPPTAAVDLARRGATVRGRSVHVTADDDDVAPAVAALAAALASHRLRVVDLSVRPPTLENVFLHLTGHALRE